MAVDPNDADPQEDTRDRLTEDHHLHTCDGDDDGAVSVSSIRAEHP